MMQISELPDQQQPSDTDFHILLKNEKLTAKEKIESLRLLFNRCIHLNLKNRNVRTVLNYAIDIRSKDIVDFLVSSKHTCDITNFKNTVVTCLIKTERIKFLELENQPQTSENEIQKWESKSVNFVDSILAEYFVIESQSSALSMAIEFNLQHILPILLKYITHVHKEKNLLIEFLRQSKNKRKEHEGKRSSVWYKNYCQRYSAKIVKYLLDKGFTPEDYDKNNNTTLYLAIDLEEHIDVIEMLINQSMYVDYKNGYGQTAFNTVIQKWLLSSSISDYYYQVARALVANGADLNSSDNAVATHLCNAVRESNLPVVQFFDECGVDFNVETSDGKSLMHLLLEKQSHRDSDVEAVAVQLLHMFISKGHKVNAKDTNGRTPLHIAAERGHTVIVQKLIEYKANVNCHTNLGITPLHNAAAYNRVDIAAILLKSRANVNAITSNGRTVLDFAKNSIVYDDIKMYELLFEHGVNLSTALIKFIPVNAEELFFKHWIKLKVANLECEINSDYEGHKKFLKYREHHKKCLEEIEILKNYLIDKSVSLYSFLQMTCKRRFFYLDNEVLKNLVDSPCTLKEKFPEYSILILGSYREAANKKLLFDLSRKAWLEFTKIVLPEVCLHCILSFLSDSDLYDLIAEI